jgi:hypothetical protein
MVLVSFVSYGQDEEVVPTIKKFEDVSTYLYTSKVVDLPNKTQKELTQQFKNWASTAFVNLKEVLVSETENQIVLVYIVEPIGYFKMMGMKTYYDTKHYVRMVGQFKDGKCKISMFDDGNVYRYGGYAGNIKMPDTQARTIHFSGANTIETPESKDLHKLKYYMYSVMCSWQNKLDETLLSCENGMKNSSLVVKLKDDF